LFSILVENEMKLVFQDERPRHLKKYIVHHLKGSASPPMKYCSAEVIGLTRDLKEKASCPFSMN